MHNLEQTFNISQVTRGHVRIELYELCIKYSAPSSKLCSNVTVFLKFQYFKISNYISYKCHHFVVCSGVV